MITVLTSNEVCWEIHNSLLWFLEDSCNIENELCILEGKDFDNAVRSTIDIITEYSKPTVIINNIKSWSSTYHPVIANPTYFDLIYSVLKKKSMFVSKYFDTDEIPDYIFDIETSDISGELQEAIISVTKSHRN